MASSTDPALVAGQRISTKPPIGSWLIVVAAAIGLVVCLIKYFTPYGEIAGSGGAQLVIVSTALMLGASLALVLAALPRWLIVLFDVLIVLDILGTGLCAYFLETPILLACMVVAFIGWVVRLARDVPQGHARY